MVFALSPTLSEAACLKSPVAPFNDQHYYATAQSLTGHTLHTALHNIIRNHQRFTYKCVWDILKDTDEDTTKSDHVGCCISNTPSPSPSATRDKTIKIPGTVNTSGQNLTAFQGRGNMPIPMCTICVPQIAVSTAVVATKSLIIVVPRIMNVPSVGQTRILGNQAIR